MTTLNYDARRVHLTRIALSPWSREANDPDELVALDARAASMGVHVSTIKRTTAPAGWVVRVFDKGYAHVTTLRASGSLTAIIAGALDDWDEAHGPAWTGGELLTVAAQSGIEVRAQWPVDHAEGE